MRLPLALLSLLLILGCAASNTSDINALRNESNLRETRRLPMTFADIQRALFRHERTCGRAPVFAAHPRDTNQARITHSLGEASDLYRRILVDLQWVYSMEGQRITAVVYANPRVPKESIAQLFQAVLDPDTCPTS